MIPLPIDESLPALKAALQTSVSAVLEAPPGAGKTTRVPLALLAEPWLGGRRMLMLEPRRLAARAAAAHMAANLGEKVGETVGYRMRSDSMVSARTRIEVVTEGVLTRMLQTDPALDGVGLVIFDEFHERSLHADLGLALALQAQRLLREDLRLLVMSATLDGAAVADLLGGAPAVRSEGRVFPVETRYVPRDATQRIERAVADAVTRALRETEGDLLAFLPGAGEIARTAALLSDVVPPGIDVIGLHGMLEKGQQDRAIAPAQPGVRKVVLATSIAETSLTIDGVRTVIDSGVMRVPRFSPRSGMSRLETVRVTRASADQRRGRAGRQAPGVCYRLWSEADHASLLAFNKPEITEADLAPLALELCAWGTPDPAELSWLDAPPAGAYAQARELLCELGAIGADGSITRHGRAMAALPMHPRLAHMTLRAIDLGYGATATLLAAILGERDIMVAAKPDPDLRLRITALRRLMDGEHDRTADHALHRDAAQRAVRSAREWSRRLGIERSSPVADGADRRHGEEAGLLIALAYPDRVAQRRPGTASRFLLRNGGSAVIDEPGLLAESEYVAIAELDGQRRESRVYRAAPITREEIEMLFGEQIVQSEEVAWQEDAGAVRAVRRARLGALTLRETAVPNPSPEAVAEALVAMIGSRGLSALPWNAEAVRMRQRIAFMRALDPSWPDVSDEALTASMHDWLAPHLYGRKRAEEIASIDLAGILAGTLSWQQRSALDIEAPSHISVPSGSRIPIDYSDPASPVLAVRLQEMFGLAETPRLARGRVPLTVHLLSPARRPVQVTRDLANFWRTTYFEVRKDLKGRYPKHYWPDDPTQATPTNRVRPR